MRTTRFLILGFFALMIGFVSFQGILALFASSASSNSNTFTAAASFPTSVLSPTPTVSVSPTPGIVINEVSSDGAPNAEWVELYNPSGVSVDVTNWVIADSVGVDAFPNASIPAGGYGIVITNASSITPGPGVTVIQLSTGTIGGAGASGLNDPGDLVRLSNSSSVVVDEMSYGDNSTVLNPAVPTPGAGQTMRRIPNGQDTNTAADWAVGASSLGGENL